MYYTEDIFCNYYILRYFYIHHIFFWIRLVFLVKACHSRISVSTIWDICLTIVLKSGSCFCACGVPVNDGRLEYFTKHLTSDTHDLRIQQNQQFQAFPGFSERESIRNAVLSKNNPQTEPAGDKRDASVH